MSIPDKKICWITATYFLDVDLPVVPPLMRWFDIDWTIIPTPLQIADDSAYIKSKTDCSHTMLCAPARFYSPALHSFFKKLIKSISSRHYDLYYFDISDFLFLFPLVKRYLPVEKVVIATHNVIVPKGARLAPLARISMSYIIRNFRNFQTFSRNQYNAMRLRKPDANIFYSPLMLKDYGNAGMKQPLGHKPVKFLFFGNVVKYKRLDVLLEAVKILIARGRRDFRIYICGYCDKSVWQKEYLPAITDTSLFELDIRRIPNDKVAEYFNTCHYFLMPYQDIAQSGAMTVALNYNMPVIASDLPTFHEFLTPDHDAYFFTPGNATALADTMQRCLDNTPEEYARLKANLNATVNSRLAPDAIINNYKEFLKNFNNA